ncbi:MAG: TlpA family protein disulfide reductase [Bacteroidales bacterium]|nr:TlpA family protein disulfide reductase [Bacteroidales bacterium]
MATLLERLSKWKETRSMLQKAGDVMFWLLLVLLIIPGPRKVIATAVNRVALHLKNPGITRPDKQVQLNEQDFNWMLQDDQGNPVYLDTFRGKVVFLNFWATWCPPCVAELPEIQKAYKKHGNKVSFLLVTAQEPEIVQTFLNKHGYELPVYYQETPVPGVFEAGSIPTTFIISRDGKIVTKKSGAVNWDSRAADRIFDELIR